MTLEARYDEACQRLFPEGLRAAIVTDRDGVIIMQSAVDDASAKLFNPIIATTFAVANNQASKLGLKRNEGILSMYELYQVVQLDQNPLIITLVGDASSNTGLFMHFGQELVSLIQPLVSALQEGQ
ncbi:Ragulator complex protein LAMTOR3 [Radiomyces spectabilis]|uniref:Ragulator complex protein LAMTOR3 n=1 Tax=Radiomyces spectabilis TaxID=64574 RepID=UPI00221F124D|nr:Ragulator complex protein LAMTOR3 [Radiomyces spectabilis]KAI8371765.1 Ragulator complex protein LAMTOR3 [Radiomyces spectabilis]